MGVAVFVGLVLMVIVLMGLLIYGVFLGLVALVRLPARLFVRAATTSGGAGTMEARIAGTATAGQGSRPALRAAKCWEIKGCEEERREACPAYRRPEAPCWLACMQADEELKPDCLACKLFNLPMMVMQA